MKSNSRKKVFEWTSLKVRGAVNIVDDISAGCPLARCQRTTKFKEKSATQKSNWFDRCDRLLPFVGPIKSKWKIFIKDEQLKIITLLKKSYIYAQPYQISSLHLTLNYLGNRLLSKIKLKREAVNFVNDISAGCPLARWQHTDIILKELSPAKTSSLSNYSNWLLPSVVLFRSRGKNYHRRIAEHNLIGKIWKFLTPFPTLTYIISAPDFELFWYSRKEAFDKVREAVKIANDVSVGCPLAHFHHIDKILRDLNHSKLQFIWLFWYVFDQLFT